MEVKLGTDISRIRYTINEEVAKLAFAGELEERDGEIPYTISPGRTPRWRCCVYREREIVRQRVNLVEGKSAVDGEPMGETIVQVLPAACEGCPINRFSVTNSCQMCMAKKCMAACNFGAISFESGHAHINPKKCKECGRCSQACPYNAIADLMRPCKRACPVNAITMDEDNIAVIDEKKCINCGHCVANCPFGAIQSRSFMVDVIKELKSDKHVYAMVAPAISGQFGANVSNGQIRQAAKALGFYDLYEVSLGADFVSQNEALELEEHVKEGKKMTTSCCPAFVNMIRKHFPQVEDCMSQTVSPMTMTGRLIKAQDPDAVCVFIGPCIAKRAEARDSKHLGGADYALTYDELASMFEAKGIDPAKFEDEKMQQGSVYGMNFSVSGGVTNAVLSTFKERNEDIDVKVCKANGAAECKKALQLLKVGRLPEDFVEGMCCEGGCVNGPAMLNKEKTFMKDRNAQIQKADQRGVLENCAKYEDLEFSKVREEAAT